MLLSDIAIYKKHMSMNIRRLSFYQESQGQWNSGYPLVSEIILTSAYASRMGQYLLLIVTKG